MKPELLQSKLDAFLAEVGDLMTSKGAEYKWDSEDQLGNFRAVGGDPCKVWWAYFFKHVAAVRHHALNPGAAAAESLRGRFLDIAGYAFLGAMLFEEDRGAIRREGS